jgi:hypothetical protein
VLVARVDVESGLVLKSIFRPYYGQKRDSSTEGQQGTEA